MLLTLANVRFRGNSGSLFVPERVINPLREASQVRNLSEVGATASEPDKSVSDSHHVLDVGITLGLR
jgi:hypothetical protein